MTTFTPKDFRHHRNKVKEKWGLETKYIWNWHLKTLELPTNWLNATPIKIFGHCIGWKVKVVKPKYQKAFFTQIKHTNPQ